MTMPRSEDWKIGAREIISRNPELRAELIKDIQKLLTTDNDEERRVGRRMASGLLELNFSSDTELLAQLQESVAA